MGDENQAEKSDDALLQELEEKFKYRYTDEDQGYVGFISKPAAPPPAVDWTEYGGERRDHRRGRYSRGRGDYRDDYRGRRDWDRRGYRDSGESSRERHGGGRDYHRGGGQRRVW